MKRSNGSLILFLLAAALNLLSCSAVNELGSKALTPDGIPEVKITNPVNNYFVDGDQEITAEVNGITDTEIDRVEFYAGGKLIFTKRTVPYASYWDTTKYPEGPTEINVKVFNRRGNFGQASISVRVSRAVYVSVDGNDTNDGSGNHPCRDIKLAYDKAVNTGKNNIYVSQGIYYPSNVIYINSNNIRLIGGYSSDFSKRVGYTELDQYSASFRIYANNVTNICIEGFIVNQDYESSGILRWYNVNNSALNDVKFFRNRSCAIIYLDLCNSNSIDVELSNNVISIGGPTADGMIHLSSSSYNTVSCMMTDNSNGEGLSGGVYIMNGCSNVITGLIKKSYSFYGGGISILYSFENTISASIINNSAYYGGGIYIVNSTNTKIMNCIITNNYSTQSNVSIYSGAGNSGLVISNCLIGGTNGSPGYAIYENSDIFGHYLLNNTFLTNTMKYLYHDFTGTNISNANWACINNPAYTGAAAAAGNTVQ